MFSLISYILNRAAEAKSFLYSTDDMPGIAVDDAHNSGAEPTVDTTTDKRVAKLNQPQDLKVQLAQMFDVLQKRRLRLQRRIVAYEMKRTLHEVAHMVGEDLMRRQDILRQRGLVTQDEQTQRLARQFQVLWADTHTPQPTNNNNV